MSIVVFASRKGGVGKSTMCVQCARERAAEGRRVIVVYCDTQIGGALLWNTTRRDRAEAGEVIAPIFKCMPLFGENIARDLRDLAVEYDDVFVDVAGADSRELRAALTVADEIVSPINSSNFDIASVGAMDEAVGIARGFNPDARARLLINRLSTNKARRTTRERDIRAALAKMQHINGFFQTSIVERSVFEEVAEQGLSVTEFGGKSLAREEFTNFYREIWK